MLLEYGRGTYSCSANTTVGVVDRNTRFTAYYHRGGLRRLGPAFIAGPCPLGGERSADFARIGKVGLTPLGTVAVSLPRDCLPTTLESHPVCSFSRSYSESKQLSAVFGCFPGRLPFISHRLTDGQFRGCHQGPERLWLRRRVWVRSGIRIVARSFLGC